MQDDCLDEADVAAAWDRNADLWAEEVRAGFDVFREHFTLPAFLAFLPEISGRDVIDLGCGEGSNTRRFAERGARVTGIDLSAGQIARARAVEEGAPLGIRYEACSFSQMGLFADGSFDVALSTMALMDGPDVAAAMREAHRVLRPGGGLWFSILHPCFNTRHSRWIPSRQTPKRARQVVGYFDRQPFVDHWHFSKRAAPTDVEDFTVPRFPRTVSDYVNAVCAAGLRITAMEEPQPSEAAVQAHPWLRRWRRHAALVLHIAAVKG